MTLPDYSQWQPAPPPSHTVSFWLALPLFIPLVDFGQAIPTVSPPPQIDGVVVPTYALYFSQTILLGR